MEENNKSHWLEVFRTKTLTQILSETCSVKKFLNFRLADQRKMKKMNEYICRFAKEKAQTLQNME